MSRRYAVLKKEGNFTRVMYESQSKNRIYVWLKGHSVLDAPGYTVLDRATSTTWEEGNFIREFEEATPLLEVKAHKCLTEEQVLEIIQKQREANVKRRANMASLGHKCLTEEQIRAIVQEELAKFFNTVHERSCVQEELTDDVVDTFTGIIGHWADRESKETVAAHEDLWHERKGRR